MRVALKKIENCEPYLEINLHVLVKEVKESLVASFIFFLDLFVFEVRSVRDNQSLMDQMGVIMQSIPCGHPSVDLSWEPFDNVVDLELFLVLGTSILIFIF